MLKELLQNTPCAYTAPVADKESHRPLVSIKTARTLKNFAALLMYSAQVSLFLSRLVIP
jgi:hypothetical protein